jgi:branched-chain amino acid aminotransferase
VGGNYAASLVAGELAHSKGYAAVLYLDPKEKKYLDECGPANFFGVRGNSYITPESGSILPSITNKSLMQLAGDMGMTVERRPVPLEELATFEEAAECGTAAVITPLSQIDDLNENKSYIFTTDNQPGPVCVKLYNKLRAIQCGDEPDPYGWVTVLL